MNSIPLEPIQASTLADEVESRLRQYFREQGLVPGDAIPKEMDLAETLGVSRNVVREALSRLRMLGMIESRKRRGMILASPDIFNGLNRVMDPAFLKPQTKKEIFELRLVLEVGMADLLFARKTEQDMQRLESIVDKEENTVDPTVRTECDIQFHTQLYKMSDNRTLQRFQALLLPVFDFVNSRHYNKRLRFEGEVVGHRALFDVLKNGDPQAFRNSMRAHLQPHFIQISQSESTEPGQ